MCKGSKIFFLNLNYPQSTSSESPITWLIVQRKTLYKRSYKSLSQTCSVAFYIRVGWDGEWNWPMPSLTNLCQTLCYISGANETCGNTGEGLESISCTAGTMHYYLVILQYSVA